MHDFVQLENQFTIVFGLEQQTKLLIYNLVFTPD